MMDRKIARCVGVFVLLTIFTGLTAGAKDDCPSQCFCHDVNNIIYCARKGLTRIPETIPASSVQLNLNGNLMESPVIEYRNVSRFRNLEHLYLSECGIERIEVGAFRDLTRLEWLDLSSNRIRVLEAYTFQGLSLNQLFLNGNRNIRIDRDAFAHFELSGLRIYECALKTLDFEAFEPLIGSLSNLWLNDNELDKLDQRFLGLFATLTHLRLGSNPLHCNCEVQWLKEFYDKNSALFDSPDEGVPSCLSPSHLKARSFNQISLFDFQCQPPSFRNVDAVVKGDRGLLRCTASGDPAPTLFWVQPSGRTTVYAPASNESVKYNEAVLNISASHRLDQQLSGSYYCFALNKAGNMTLTFNLTWPSSDPQGEAREPIINLVPGGEVGRGEGEEGEGDSNDNSEPKRRRTSSTTGSPTAATRNSDSVAAGMGGDGDLSVVDNSVKHTDDIIIVSTNNTQEKDLLNKRGESGVNVNRISTAHLYTLAELLGAILGTFACTLLLCCIAIPLYFRGRWKNNNNSPHHGSMSNSHQRHVTLDKATLPQETMYLNGSGSRTVPPQLPPRPIHTQPHSYHYFDYPTSSTGRLSNKR